MRRKMVKILVGFWKGSICEIVSVFKMPIQYAILLPNGRVGLFKKKELEFLDDEAK